MASGSRENPLALVQFPFTAGIDEGTRDEVVEAGAAWLVLENGRQDQTGGYSTRTGFDAFANAGVAPSASNRIFADGTSIVRLSDDTAGLGGVCAVFDSAAGQWVQLGSRVSSCIERLIAAPTLGTAAHLEDIAYTNGYFCIAWLVTVAGIYYPYVAVINAKSGAIVSAPAVLSGFSPCLLTVDGNSFICVRGDTAAVVIRASAFDTTNATSINLGWVAMTNLAADYVGPQFSVCSLPDATNHRCAIVYPNNLGGTSQATLKTFGASGVIQTQVLTTAAVAPLTMDVQGSIADTLWVSWDEGLNIRLEGFHPTAITSTPLASTATIATVVTGALNIHILPTATAGQGRLFINDTDATMRAQIRGFKTTAGAAATNGTQQTIYGIRACTRPALYQGISLIHAFVGDSANTQQQVMLVDWSDDVTYTRPVANPSPGLGSVGIFQQCSIVTGAVSGRLYSGLGIVKSGVTDSTSIVEYDFKSTSRWQPCSHAGSVFLSGAVAMEFDGRRVAEAGFLMRPRTPTTATSGTGISFTTGARYVCVFEEVDTRGNWHISGVSTPSASTGAVANKTITVSTSPLVVSSRIDSTGSKSSSVRVAFYRTTDGGVAPYYRLGTTINDTSASTVSFADTTDDTTLAAAAKLYEQPGVIGTAQDHRTPPGLSILTSYNGMLAGASGSDVWYSGQSVYGEGTWFNPVFQIPVPGDGDITAMWVMDGTLFVAKRREIYAIVGEAPSDNAASGGLGLPRRLAVDVGCIESRSVCVTAFGTFFQSDRGIEILTRAQATQWIGQPVQNTLAAYPIVTSATVEPVSCCLFIELAASQAAGLVTGSGRTLVYDLSLQKWVSTDRRTSSAGTVDTPSQSACMIYTGTDYRYGWLGTNGVVYHGNDTHLDANGAIVAKRAVSANIRTAGFQGLQHVNKALLLAKYRTPHDLSVSFAYDYASSYKTARVYTAADLLAVSSTLPNMQLEHDMHDDARCEAVRVQLQDVTPSSGALGTGAAATWIALSFEIVPQTGAYGLPDASR